MYVSVNIDGDSRNCGIQQLQYIEIKEHASCPPSLNFSLWLAVEKHIRVTQYSTHAPFLVGTFLSQVIKEYAPVILHQQSKILHANCRKTRTYPT